MTTYEVTYTLDSNGSWFGSCDAVQANTFGDTIAATRRHMVEAIQVSLDGNDPIDLDEVIIWDSGELDHAFADVRAARLDWEGAQDRLRRANADAIARWRLLSRRTGLRDLGEGLGVSLGRVQQLVKQSESAVAATAKREG